MAKSSKKSKEATVTESKLTPPNGEPATTNGTARAEKRPAAKIGPKKPVKAPRLAGKARSISPRKSATGKAREVKPAPAPEAGPLISDDQIRMRAYFISERRVQEGLPGDSAHDWLEAVRQLQDEKQNA